MHQNVKVCAECPKILFISYSKLTMHKWTRLLEHTAFEYIIVRTYNGEMNKVSDGRVRRHLAFIPTLVSEIQMF